MPLRIRDLREDHNLTQAQIAALLHVTQATYSRYETEDLDIPHSSLQILANYYHTSVDYLLGRTNHPTPYPKN